MVRIYGGGPPQRGSGSPRALLTPAMNNQRPSCAASWAQHASH